MPTNKEIRDRREFETLFKNPSRARKAWSQNVIDRYCKPALEPIPMYDKNGQPTPEYQIELAVWENLKKEIAAEGIDRMPTEGEMMEACQSYYARHNPSAYVARRDSMGAKPVDETRTNVSLNNPYADMSDEELLVMEQARQEYLREQEENNIEVNADDSKNSDNEQA